MSVPSWSVVSTVREPLPLVLAFACHHLSMGAQTVHLFFDDPDDPVADILATVPGVDITRCDAAHWAQMGNGNRPGWQTRRQTLNANLIAQQQRSDWLLHVDADEFLWAPEGIEAELAQATTWLNIPNVERVWTTPEGNIFDGLFRTPTREEQLVQQVYGPTSRYLENGLSGHGSGKAMARLADRNFIGIHRVKENRQGATIPYLISETARILHFDGMTARHWLMKPLRHAIAGPPLLKTMHASRRASVARLLAAQDLVSEGVQLHQEKFHLTQAQQDKLLAWDALMECPLDIPQAVKAIAPDVALDLSSSQFDASISNAFENAVALIGKQSSEHALP